MRRSVVGVVALLALTSSVFAQPTPDPLPVDQRGASGTTKIPVTIDGGTEVMGAEGEGASSKAAPIALEEPIDPKSYICGPGDVFELNFWGKQNFRLRIAADLEGRTFISKVGFVDVAGKTLAVVRDTIKKKVRGDYPGLMFELTLVSPRTFLVHVVNNVKQPGAYPSHPIERVSTVLAHAGGATGSRRRISVRHRNGTVATADLVLYELTGDTAYNPFVLDGDVISVPFAEVTATISGAVHRPGAYELVKTKDLAELLALADGFTSGVARSLPIRIVRRNAKQQETFAEVAFSAAPNAPLHDDDKVFVRGTDDLQRSVMLLGAVVGSDPVDAATTSKRLPFVEGDSVLSLIDRAGGIKAPGDLRRAYIARPRANVQPEMIPIDLDALLVKRDFASDKEVKMGDTIVVPPMQYSILVEGAVARAGLYSYNPLFGVPEYIAHAGGRTRTAQDMDDVKLVDANGKTRSYKSGLKLAPGDAILVPERSFSRAEVAQLVLAGAGLILSGVAITLAATR